MPGFNINNTGSFQGVGPTNTNEVRRKHRWVFETIGRGTGTFPQTALLVLQSASRPSFKFEEPEMHHNQEVVRFAGKQDWDPVTMVWYDNEQTPDISREIYHWLETVVNMTTLSVAHPSQYKRNSSLALLTGTGAISERWRMYGTWPASINWQDLDYTSTDLLTCETTMRYDRAVRECFTPGISTIPQPSCV